MVLIVLGRCPGFWVASHAGDGDGVQCSVQGAVAAAVEAMPGALPAACLERGDSGQRCERCFVADPPVVGPADQQLRGDDRADPGFGEQCRPCWVLFDQVEQLRIEFGELLGQKRIRTAIDCRVKIDRRCSTGAAGGIFRCSMRVSWTVSARPRSCARSGPPCPRSAVLPRADTRATYG